ncbi:cytochrome P450 [Multifurca ochricompacta]|uniref:Cytochrome P450 n=1 Tax=Multifurca ochricompacta TaxID=376703 RepID=A0AAD4M7U0_9AGAM|nr:cytochrome P450 [Multifurca ochricompacta]
MLHAFALAQHSLITAVHTLLLVALVLSGASVAYVLCALIFRRWNQYRSPLKNVPGPKNAQWFKGNFVDVLEVDSTRLQEEWVQTYGHVLKYHGVFGAPKLLAVDPVAVSYIFHNSDTFQKSELLRFSLGSFTGRGLLFVEEAGMCIPLSFLNKSHDRDSNPAFGPAQVRKFTTLFLEQSLQLREIWGELVSGSSRKDGKLSLDVFNWLNKVTLDIIGLAGIVTVVDMLISHSELRIGFDYNFDSLHSSEEKQNELYEAIRSILTLNSRNIFFVFQLFFPVFRLIPTPRSRALDRAFEVVQRIGSRLIKDKKAVVLTESNTDGSGVVEKQDVRGHDLLSLLIKSNIASDMPESMRMSDSEILSQVPTFLVAGHETTSTAVAWTLFALSCHTAVQTKLRAELNTLPTDLPTMEQLNALSYLDGVVREALRLYAPVTSTQRIAMEDAEIPLQKPFMDKRGILQSSVRVFKGDSVVIPIRLLNQSTEIWGEDANEFRPERWESIPEAVHGLPSVFGHLLTFIAGAHACIGYRFSVVEIKALLFTLVRGFEFELAMPAEEIMRKTSIVSRPVIGSNPAAGPQLPLLIRPANLD